MLLAAGKDTQYKLFWIGNQEGNGGVGVMLAEKWIQKVIHVNRVNDSLMLLKVLVVGKKSCDNHINLCSTTRVK